MNGRRITDLIVVAAILAVCAWFYIGFFHPDPYVTEDVYFPRMKTILTIIRIVVPFMVAGIIAVYLGLRSKKLAPSHLVLAGGAFVFTLLLVYPLANHIFQDRYFKKVELFHPYLQLTPHDFELRPGDRKDKFVIVCLGGSTTEFTNHEGIGWTTLLEQNLNGALPNKTIEVYNQGRQWYTIQHSLINYEINVRPKRPDMIIIMQSINDLAHNADFAYFSHGPFRDDYGHFYGPINRALEHPDLAEYVASLFRGYWYHQPRRIVDTGEFPGLPSYRTKLKTIIDLARGDSTAVVLMTEAYLFKEPISDAERSAIYMLYHEAIGPDRQWSMGTAIRGMDAYNNVLRDVAREDHLPLVDLEKSIPKTLGYFYDEVHYADTTHAIAARLIADRIIASGLLR